MHCTGRTGTADIVSDADFCITYLPRIFYAASKLLEHLHCLACAGCTEWMTFGFEATARVNADIALVSHATLLSCEHSTFASTCKSEIFGRHKFSNGEAIVHFCQIDVGCRDAGCFVSCIRSLLCGTNLGDAWSIVESEKV